MIFWKTTWQAAVIDRLRQGVTLVIGSAVIVDFSPRDFLAFKLEVSHFNTTLKSLHYEYMSTSFLWRGSEMTQSRYECLILLTHQLSASMISPQRYFIDAQECFGSEPDCCSQPDLRNTATMTSGTLHQLQVRLSFTHNTSGKLLTQLTRWPTQPSLLILVVKWTAQILTRGVKLLHMAAIIFHLRIWNI